MEIRKCLETDASRASEIYALSWKTAYQGIVPQTYLDELPLDQWTPFLKESSNIDFVLLDGGKYIGVSSVSEAGDKNKKMCGWGEIVSIYILPKHFGMGYGKKLFSYMIDYLKQHGYDKIYLWVFRENKRARAFYEHNGFSPTEDISNINIEGKEIVEIKYVNTTK